MDPEPGNIILLRTKLHRPPVAHNHVHRSRLLERLNKNRHKSVNLVSAPAGYGKSILVSCWLEESKDPGAWLSIDEDDNDIRRFLSHFIAAIQTIHPHIACKTQTLIDSTILPPQRVLTTTLVKELDLLDNDFNIVLDDIQVGVGIAKTTKLGKKIWKFKLEFHKYVEQPDTFGSDWLVKFTITPVIKNPFVFYR